MDLSSKHWQENLQSLLENTLIDNFMGVQWLRQGKALPSQTASLAPPHPQSAPRIPTIGVLGAECCCPQHLASPVLLAGEAETLPSFSSPSALGTELHSCFLHLSAPPQCSREAGEEHSVDSVPPWCSREGGTCLARCPISFPGGVCSVHHPASCAPNEGPEL